MPTNTETIAEVLLEEDVRFWQDGWNKRILIRTAKHDNDYCSFTGIPEYLKRNENWILR